MYLNFIAINLALHLTIFLFKVRKFGERFLKGGTIFLCYAKSQSFVYIGILGFINTNVDLVIDYS